MAAARETEAALAIPAEQGAPSAHGWIKSSPAAALLARQQLTEAQTNQLQELIQGMQRDINCLGDEDKNVRKSGIKTLHVNIFGGLSDNDTQCRFEPPVAKAGSHAAGFHLFAGTLTYATALFAHLLKAILRLYGDAVEKTRELAIDLVSKFLHLGPEGFLPYYIPVLVARLGGKEVQETVEELRAALMQQVERVIDTQSGQDLGIYIDEWLQVFRKMIDDEFAEVKRMGCRCTVLLARKTPERFHMAAGQLVPPLQAALVHQHTKVRAVAVRALGAVVQYGQNKLLDDVRTNMSQRVMDHSPTVRKAVYTIAGRWLCELRDRYSYWHKLLPMLLPGETDEVEELRVLSREAFIKAGRLYEQENEERLKDQLDFRASDNDGAAVSAPLGCRELVKECFSKIFPGLLKDMIEWTADTRRQAARLMHTLLRYEGKNVTMHLQKVVGGLMQACLDEEPDIAKLVVECGEEIGRSAAFEACAAVIYPVLRDAGASERQHAAALIMLAAFVRGADVTDMSTQAAALCHALAEANVRESASRMVQEELLLCIADVIDKLQDQVAPHGLELFHATLSVSALSKGLDAEVEVALQRLATAMAFLLSTLSLFFNALFKAVRAGVCIGMAMIDHTHAANCQPEKDVEVRIRFFTLLGRLLTHAREGINADGKLSSHTRTIIKQLVCPNLVWQSGDKAQAVRVASLSCLWSLLRTETVSHEDILDVAADLLPLLVSSMEDSAVASRVLAVRVLEEIFRLHGTLFQASYETYDRLHKLYPDLLRRLDDSDNDVRLLTCQAWIAYLRIMDHDTYDNDLYKAHSEAIFRGLLIHLDDPDERVQDAVEAALQAGAKVNEEIFREQIELCDVTSLTVFFSTPAGGSTKASKPCSVRSPLSTCALRDSRVHEQTWHFCGMFHSISNT
ncbi:uncharacterized protein MONBRDRAFT_33000 [Monosiga brevicollis MX1]|uniref:TOG domain-containing protein n=1 Tax=Monosiga brevicollis TaxID=81824 RepID=A9V2Y7_MONBE|nr:uncharacterized protein MONBRDRAFT_33000 [Monosiga brevicollis MX1]EDQ87966.1 predicted protein [Monosiga brevicollis MX1]|eukprot:XP_001747042.1 hypothetical protein [Monosiga brevicollis MX1]